MKIWVEDGGCETCVRYKKCEHKHEFVNVHETLKDFVDAISDDAEWVRIVQTCKNYEFFKLDDNEVEQYGYTTRNYVI